MLTRVNPPTIELIPWGSAALIRAAYLRHLDDGAFERLGPYEAALWRQIVQRCLRSNYQASINSWSVPHIAGDLVLDLIGGFPVQFLARMWGSIWQRVTRVRVLCRAVI